MKTILASAAAVALWAAVPQPAAAAMPLAAGLHKADAAVTTIEVAYRRHYRHRAPHYRYVAPRPYYYSYGAYPYGYYPYRYYRPGPFVQIGPFGFGIW